MLGELITGIAFLVAAIIPYEPRHHVVAPQSVWKTIDVSITYFLA